MGATATAAAAAVAAAVSALHTSRPLADQLLDRWLRWRALCGQCKGAAAGGGKACLLLAAGCGATARASPCAVRLLTGVCRSARCTAVNERTLYMLLLLQIVLLQLWRHRQQ